MREHTGPPFAKPTIDEIRTWPQDTSEQLEAKRAAARLWIVQFCTRARFNLGATDLRILSRQHEKCAREIDKARALLVDMRPLLTDKEIEEALIG